MPKVAFFATLGIFFAPFLNLVHWTIIGIIGVMVCYKVSSKYYLSSIIVLLLVFFSYAILSVKHNKENPLNTKAKQNVIIPQYIKKGKKSYHGIAKVVSQTKEDTIFKTNKKVYFFLKDTLTKNKIYLTEGYYKKTDSSGFGRFLNSIEINEILYIKKHILTSEQKIAFFNTDHFLDKTKIKNDANKSIYGAIVFGDKSKITKEINETFKNSGLSHILVVSGLHLGILYVVLSFIFSNINVNSIWIKKYCFPIVIVLIIWIYAIVTGLGTPVIRAAFMFSLFAIAKISEKRVNIYNILASSFVVMITYNPNYIYQIGFLMSYVAVFGIVYTFECMGINKIKNKYIKYIVSLFMVSISAQLFLLPILLKYFKSFPIYFIFPNLFSTLLVIPLIFFGLSLVLLYKIDILNILISKILDFFLSVLFYIANFFSKLPYASIKISLDKNYTVFIYYLLIIFVLEMVYYKKNKTLVLY